MKVLLSEMLTLKLNKTESFFGSLIQRSKPGSRSPGMKTLEEIVILLHLRGALRRLLYFCEMGRP